MTFTVVSSGAGVRGRKGGTSILVTIYIIEGESSTIQFQLYWNSPFGNMKIFADVIQ